MNSIQKFRNIERLKRRCNGCDEFNACYIGLKLFTNSTSYIITAPENFFSYDDKVRLKIFSGVCPNKLTYTLGEEGLLK